MAVCGCEPAFSMEIVPNTGVANTITHPRSGVATTRRLVAVFASGPRWDHAGSHPKKRRSRMHQAARVARVMIESCGLTPRLVGTALPSTTYSSRTS